MNFSNVPKVKVPRANGFTYFNNGYHHVSGYKTDVRDQVPKHYFTLVNSLMMNADMRRLVGIGIAMIFKSSKTISPDTKVYTRFLWNKFSVKFNGMKQEFSYTENFFMVAYIAACQAMLRNSIVLLNDFSIKTTSKNLEESVNKEEYDELTQLILNYTSKTSENVEQNEEDNDEDDDEGENGQSNVKDDE